MNNYIYPDKDFSTDYGYTDDRPGYPKVSIKPVTVQLTHTPTGQYVEVYCEGYPTLYLAEDKARQDLERVLKAEGIQA